MNCLTLPRYGIRVQGLVVSINGGFRKVRGNVFGVPIMRTMIFWGLYWGPPIWGNDQIGDRNMYSHIVCIFRYTQKGTPSSAKPPYPMDLSGYPSTSGKYDVFSTSCVGIGLRMPVCLCGAAISWHICAAGASLTCWLSPGNRWKKSKLRCDRALYGTFPKYRIPI